MDNSTEEKWTTKPNILKTFGEQNLDRHIHSYDHHKAFEQSKCSEQMLKCEACDVVVNGQKQYKQHIATRKHKRNMHRLSWKKHRNVDRNIDVELKTQYNKKRKLRKERGLESCFVCCNSFLSQDLDKHMHSLNHHRAIWRLKGSNQVHICFACDVAVTGIEQYANHVATAHHRYMMVILNEKTAKEKTTMDYSVQFDDELKALCAQRDQQRYLKKKQRLLKSLEVRKAKREAKCQMLKQKAIQNGQTRNKRNVDFTSDELPLSCYFNFCEAQQKFSTIRPNQKVSKRRQESMLDMGSLNCPIVKRPHPPSEIPAQEMSACVSGPTPDGKVADVCSNEMTSENELAVSVKSMCALEPVQRDDSYIPTMIGTIQNSIDPQSITVGSDVHVKSCTRKVEVQSCRTELDQQPKRSKNEHKKKRLVKGKKSEQSMSNHSLEKSTQEPCSDDVIPALRNDKQNQKNAKQETNLPQEQDIPGEEINGQEASVASVTSLAEKIGKLDSQTLATGNESDRNQKVQPNTEHVISEDHNHFQTISRNLQKNKRKRQFQDIPNISQENPEANDTSKQKNVTKLMTLCLKEEKLSSSLENVGEQLFQAYSTLQSAYTEVQHLLAVKQKVTSEMVSLRGKRLKILQDMKNPCRSHTSECSEDLT